MQPTADSTRHILSALAPIFVPASTVNIDSGTVKPSRLHELSTLKSKITTSNYKPAYGNENTKVYYFNARSIRSRLFDLHQILYSGLYSVICISESWLSPNIVNGLIDDRGWYNIYRRDRPGPNPGGGVCILVLKGLQSSMIDCARVMPNDVYDNVEIVGCTISMNTLSFTITCVYLAPNLNSEQYVLALTCLQTIYSTQGEIHITVGDFNLPRINWSTLTGPPDTKCMELIDLCIRNNLTQLVTESTRMNNILDLVLCNDHLLVVNLCILEPFCRAIMILSALIFFAPKIMRNMR